MNLILAIYTQLCRILCNKNFKYLCESREKQLKAERLLHILTINQYFYSFNKSHPSLRVQVQDRRIWSLWKLPPFQRSVIRVPRMKTSLTLKKMTVMMTMTEVSLIELHFAIWRAFRFVFLQNFLKKIESEKFVKWPQSFLWLLVIMYRWWQWWWWRK